MNTRIRRSWVHASLGLGLWLSAPNTWAGSPPDLLTDAEVARLDQVEPFAVVIEPIGKNSTADHLADACAELSEAIVDLPVIEFEPRALLQQELTGGQQAPLSVAIRSLRTLDPSDAGKPQKATEVAGELAILGRDIDRLCRRISAGMLDEQDIPLLRSIYREGAKTILRYEQLLTKPASGNTRVVDLVAKIIAGTSTAEDLDRFIEALAVEPTGMPQSLPSTVSLGSAASTLFEGMAEFLVDRAKEEALGYVRDTLVEELCGSDLRVFIPSTCEVMSDLDPRIALTAIGKLLHSAVLEDLAGMPDRLLVLAWMRSPTVAPTATLVRVALPMLEQAKSRKSPLEHAASIYAMPEADCELQPVVVDSGDDRCADTLAYLRGASALLRASASNVEKSHTQRDLPFLSLAVAFEFEQLFAELPESARRRLASKLERAGLQFSAKLMPNFSVAGLNGLAELIAASLTTASELEHTLDELGKTNQLTGESVATPEAILAAARANLVGLAELAGSVIQLDPNALSTAPDSLPAVLAATGRIVSFSEAIRSDDWGQSALAIVDIVDAVAELAEVDTELEATLDEVRRYLPLFVEVANAKSSADVKAALEVAFPAGGYRLKYRQTTVSLNAFLGGYGGGVYLLGDAPQLTGEAAMFAPIGVEIGGPVKHTKRKAWHFGLLVAILDLGAITTSKFLETEVAESPADGTGDVTTVEEPAKFNVAGLLSPGAYLTIGIAESPFGLGFGASVNPFALQQVDRSYVDGEVDSQSQRYLTALRFGAFLAVDITLVAFGRKGRSKR